MRLTFTVESALYEAGITEDGERFIAEMYYVVATDRDGSRYIHTHVFKGARQLENDDTYAFEDVRAEAQAAVSKLLDKILRSGGRIDLGVWAVGRPVYGSSAYIGQQDAIMERLEAHE
jgi:hypothetical protein